MEKSRPILSRGCKKPDVVYALFHDVPDDALTPKTYGQALRHPDSDQWKRAIGEELASLYQDRQCWEYVAYPR